MVGVESATEERAMTTRDRLTSIFFAFGILLVFVSVPIMLTLGRTSPPIHDATCVTGFLGFILIVAAIARRDGHTPQKSHDAYSPTDE